MIGLATMIMRQAEREAGRGWNGILVDFGGPVTRYLACKYTRKWPLSRRYYQLLDACPLRMSGRPQDQSSETHV